MTFELTLAEPNSTTPKYTFSKGPLFVEQLEQQFSFHLTGLDQEVLSPLWDATNLIEALRGVLPQIQLTSVAGKGPQLRTKKHEEITADEWAGMVSHSDRTIDGETVVEYQVGVPVLDHSLEDLANSVEELIVFLRAAQEEHLVFIDPDAFLPVETPFEPEPSSTPDMMVAPEEAPVEEVAVEA